MPGLRPLGRAVGRACALDFKQLPEANWRLHDSRVQRVTLCQVSMQNIFKAQVFIMRIETNYCAETTVFLTSYFLLEYLDQQKWASTV